MNAPVLGRAALATYLVLFFAFLFGPLIIMGVTAFNTPSYPQAWPFEGFTLQWFGKLVSDRNLMEGLRTVSSSAPSSSRFRCRSALRGRW